MTTYIIKESCVLVRRYTVEADSKEEARSKPDQGLSTTDSYYDEDADGSHQIEEINDIIYSELVKGIIKDKSKDRVISIIQEMIYKGIEAIILGCTEIPLLVESDQVSVPVFDTTLIHAEMAVQIALGERQLH